MEALMILVMIVAVISAAATNAIDVRLLAAGHGWFRSTAVLGLTGFLAAIAIIAA
jgi:hypothetical protein